jgi:hypothetical protein
MSPFDKRLSDLTTPQIAWILANHYKDQEEAFTPFKYLMYFMNPEAARKLFDKGQQDDFEVSEANEDEFLKEVQEHASSDVSIADINSAFAHPDSGPILQDLDTIEVVDKE